MKIKTAKMTYEEALALPQAAHQNPLRQYFIFRLILLLASIWDLWRTRFTYRLIHMEKLGKNEPCLILMNHSSFIDLKVAARLLCTRPFHIICTLDGFVGKPRLMRLIGCIPTRKFMTDVTLVRDMVYATKTLKSSILMFPEASYSFDGTQTPLPDSLGKCLKILKVPVVMIRTEGAFARDPLYNNLQLRKVRVSAEVEYLLSPEEIDAKSPQELNDFLKEKFTFDYFRWQQENKVRIQEPFRADGLNRMLYKCPHCQQEGEMLGQGTTLTCKHCGKSYELTEYGHLKPITEKSDGSKAPLTPISSERTFTHVPDWYRWERECVRQEILSGTYRMEIPVAIYMLVNTKKICQVGEGTLTHSEDGFHLTGCEGKLDYRQEPLSSYSLYSDFFWYEIGDMISIGNERVQYYCFPQGCGDIVAKARLATEELYKIAKNGMTEAQ
ncbi:MAG: 1-acyl-sn-glycerol-3-phosphate acyltransferase [Lachnospiraceae bacterium]|nr:1-acyl-sn-glycerol-3-phosphate acyltransferase [Lachnospiraceae bacterium]MDE7179161.1 1-acyl-sn-glycerol-3-phosphate acyltransferase [Lachnospiraceae bacterium]